MSPQDAMSQEALEQWMAQMRQWLADIQVTAAEVATAANRSAFAARKLLVSTKDPKTYYQTHGVNTGIYAAIIGARLNYTGSQLKLLAYACIAHDVGNVYVPDEVLNKPGPLTKEETALMKLHTRHGAELLKSLGAPKEVCLVALEHHERIDGRGYPTGIEGSAMHEFSRICAVADAYDALTSHRPHEKGTADKYAREVMVALSGKFDPALIALVGD